MNQVKYLGTTLVIMILLFFVFSQTVYASIDVVTFDQAACVYYIDPGTGSLFIQLLIGAVVGGLALMGVYRMKVKNFLHNLFRKRKGDEES